MGFSRQKYWSGLPFPPPEDLPNPGIKPASLMSPAWAGGFFTTSATWEAQRKKRMNVKPYDPAIPLLGIHIEETRSERDTCTPMFITAVLIIARTWKQPRCPSADEWIRKLWYIYTMEYYSAIKKNNLSQF